MEENFCVLHRTYLSGEQGGTPALQGRAVLEPPSAVWPGPSSLSSGLLRLACRLVIFSHCGIDIPFLENFAYTGMLLNTL